MAYEFDTTVLGGLPVTIGFDTTGYDNRDVGLGVDGVDDWWIEAVGGKTCKKSPAWLYKRIADQGETDRIVEECYDHKGGY